jgi:transposase
MAGVMIGIDPHKASHTAVALDGSESMLGQVRIRATAEQVEQLLRWAQAWPERTWAIEGARGLGHLLAQQLLATGERVLDVQPKLVARVRLLNTGKVSKNDPNDARSVAVAAMRSSDPRAVAGEDHTAVMKLWARRHRDLSRARSRVVCRLHAVLCELVPGGFPKHISAKQAEAVLQQIQPYNAVAQARLALANELLEDLRRIDAQRREAKKRIAQIVKAAPTRLTDLRGVGPVVAATVLGYVGDIDRFPTRDSFAAYNGTAPIEASSGSRTVHRLSLRGNRQLNHAIHMAAVTQLSHPSAGQDYYLRKRAEGMPPKTALRALKRKVSDALYAQMIADHRRTAGEDDRDPGGHTGNNSASSAAGSHPDTPALRTSHSRAASNSRSTDPAEGARSGPRKSFATRNPRPVLTQLPAPDRR